MNSCALDISDLSIKYGELLATPAGLRLGRFGQEKIPPGVIISGKIEKEVELVEILTDLRKRQHLRFVRISLPEEQMYLFTLSLPKMKREAIRDTILLQLEEHIPLQAIDTTFDYDIVSLDEQTIFIEVLAIATTMIESYLSVFRASGLVPLSFELEAQAIARAVIPKGDPSPVMIIDFGAARTGVSIAHHGRVFFTTTLDIGGSNLTSMIAKNFSIPIEKAEELKRSHGLDGASGAGDIFPVILNGLSVLRDELNKQYLYWKTHGDEGTTHQELSRIILSGGDANLSGLAEYLESSMAIKVENADAWVNISDMTLSVPEMSFEESFGYATILGLCLADYIQAPSTMINVLPEGEKKALRKEYWMRYVSVTLSLFALTAAFATLLLFPSYYFSKSKTLVAENRLEAFNRANPEIASHNLDAILADTNSKLALLASTRLDSPVSDVILSDIVALRPKGIVLSQILYNEPTDKVKAIEIRGTASDRATLRTFKSSLDANPHFSLVTLPISNFLEPSNIHFSISITVK
jgi:type IV pilus assembly protein PilM